MSDENAGPGPWVVYMAIEDGAILLSTVEDDPLLVQEREWAGSGVSRT